MLIIKKEMENNMKNILKNTEKFVSHSIFCIQFGSAIIGDMSQIVSPFYLRSQLNASLYSIGIANFLMVFIKVFRFLGFPYLSSKKYASYDITTLRIFVDVH